MLNTTGPAGLAVMSRKLHPNSGRGISDGLPSESARHAGPEKPGLNLGSDFVREAKELGAWERRRILKPPAEKSHTLTFPQANPSLATA